MAHQTITAPHLPMEIAEDILSALTNTSREDPTMLWTYCRQLSSFQKRKIEKHFWNFWLSKLIITLSIDGDHHVDYAIHQDTSTTNKNQERPTLVHFRALDGTWCNYHRQRIHERWQSYGDNGRNFHQLRLGEGFLNDAFQGGYIVNDTAIPNLTVENGGMDIYFDWTGAFDRLLGEEMLLRKIRERMLNDELKMYKGPVSTATLVKLLSFKIQMLSRVEVYKRRYQRHDPSGGTAPVFHKYSRMFHKQTPTVNTPSRAWHGPTSRVEPPDIFEIVSQEESVVFYLSNWKHLSSEELLDGFFEETSWRHVQRSFNPNIGVDEGLRRSRKMLSRGSENCEEQLRRLKGVQRWDAFN